MEKSEDQIAKEKDAVASIRGAKQNMELLLSRISTLETALKGAHGALKKTKEYVGLDTYIYGGKVSVHQQIDNWIVDIVLALGK